jgi:hypothetical protein
MGETKEVLKDVAKMGSNVVKETFEDVKKAVKSSAKNLAK